MIPYTLNDTGLTFFLKGQKTYRRDFNRFDELVAAVISGDVSVIDDIINVRQLVTKFSHGNVIITTDDEVMFQGKLVPEYLAERIISHMNNSIPVEPLCAFAEKLMANPNTSVRDDLYKWLEKGEMPIFADGDFMAYKLVRHDFTPIHKGGQYGQDQSIGQIVTQPRETCNEDRGVSCSSGLHFCSYEYLPTFQNMNGGEGNRVIVLKINPTDVVAIPHDYNDTKGRTCRFEVIDTIDKETIKDTFGGQLVLNEVGTYSAPKSVDNSNVTGLVDRRSEAEAAMVAAGNVKTQAAAALGISRSTLNRWLAMAYTNVADPEEDIEDDFVIGIEVDDDSWDSWDDEPSEMTNYEKAEAALEYYGTKTAAANSLEISRSTLNRWLKN